MTSSSASEEFPRSAQNRVRRVPDRGSYDQRSVYQVLDAALVAHVAFIQEGSPFVIPMLFARQDNRLLFHGSTKSRLMLALASGQPLCIGVTLLDGLVLAKSLFHHSMNYRSATVFGSGVAIREEAERMSALRVISDKIMLGRWEYARPPTSQEMKATLVAAVEIETASTKVRLGGPKDDAEDESLPIWSGTVPLSPFAGPAVSDANSTNLPVPDHVQQWRASVNRTT